MVQRAQEVQHGQQHLEHRPTEVREVVPGAVVPIEVLGVALEAHNLTEVRHQEVAAIDLQEAEAQVPEVAEAIEVLVAAQEVRVVAIEVRVVHLDHLLAEDHLQAEVVEEDSNSQSYLKYT